TAETATHTLHNLYTLRGAKVRDALLWSGFIDEAIGLFPDAEVVFASHHWPVWGRERVVDYLKKQRDTYKYIHDQTLRLANQGLGPEEIAEQLELPESLRSSFADRDYYGTVSHDSKAVYQFYFGWYDGNPAPPDPLPPAEAAATDGEFMGGAAEVRGVHGRGGGGEAQGAGLLRARRVPLGRDGARPRRVREPRGRRGQGAAGTRLRPARLPGRVGTLARRVSERRVRAAPRGVEPGALACQHRGRAAPPARGPLLRLDGGAAQRPEGGRQGSEAELRVHRSRRVARGDRGERGPAPRAARPGSGRRRHGPPDARLPGAHRHRSSGPSRD